MVARTASATNARDGVRVNFEDDGGGGAPVVILGGFLDPIGLVRRTPIAQALAAFADEFRLIFVDHRGHGRSDKPHDADAYAMPLRVADVVAVLDELQIQRAHLLGISWGGRLCFGVGQHAPERVRSLIAIGQHPYEIDRDGPLARVVGDALEASKQRRSKPSSRPSRRSPGATRMTCDRRTSSVTRKRCGLPGRQRPPKEPSRRISRRGACDVSSALAEDDADFFEDARRAAAEIPNAEFVMHPRDRPPRRGHRSRRSGHARRIANDPRPELRRRGTGLRNRSQEVLLPFEGEQQQVDHAERLLSGPRVGRQPGSRTIEILLPSMARWKVSATIRAPTPFNRPWFSSASRRM